MKLFSFLGPDCEDLLPAWLAYYRALGMTEFRLVLHGSAPEQTRLEQCLVGHPVQIVDRFEGEFEEREKCARLNAAIRNSAGEWICVVDSDEFVELPCRTLRRTIATLGLINSDALYAPLIQRISATGELSRVSNGADLWRLFPLASTHLGERMGAVPPFCQKYPLFFNADRTRIRKGNHFSPNGSATDEMPIRGVTHHFKWRAAMLETISYRSSLQDANAGEISAYRIFLETHDMCVPLEGAFSCSRKTLFTLGLLRRPGGAELRQSLLLDALREASGEASGDVGSESAARARRFGRIIRARSSLIAPAAPPYAHGFKADPGHLVSRPLRICFATWELFGIKGSGGIATSTSALAELLARAGHEVTIFYQPTPWLDLAFEYLIAEYADRGIKLEQQRVHDQNRRGTVWAAHSLHCHRWLAARDFDIVHFPDCFGYGQYAMRAKRQGIAFQKTFFCVTLHGCSEWGRREHEHPFIPADCDCFHIESESVRLADAVISPSRFMLDWWRSQGIELPERTFVHPNILRPSCRRFHDLSNTRTVTGLREAVFMGRIEERKGAILFCDALDRLSEAGELPENFRVAFLGKPEAICGLPANKYIAQRASAWRFPWSILSGLSMQRAIEYITQPGCFAVMPSLGDNYPNTVLECVGAGIPFIAVDSGGVPEIIHPLDRERVLVNGDPASLAGKIDSALLHGLPVSRPAWDFNEVDLRWLEWHGSLEIPESPAIPPLVAESGEVTVCLTSDGRLAGSLEKSVEALLGQTYESFKVILAIGGFETADPPHDFKKLEARITGLDWRVLHLRGASHAALMLKAAEMATGSRLIFLRDHQIAYPQFVETLLSAASATGASIVSSGVIRNNAASGGRIIDVRTGGTAALGTLWNCFGGPHFLIERRLFLELGGVSNLTALRDHECWHLFLRASVAGHRIEVVPEPLIDDFFEPALPLPNVIMGPYLETIPREIRPLALLAGLLMRQDPHMQPGFEANLPVNSEDYGSGWLSADLFANNGRIREGNIVAFDLANASGHIVYGPCRGYPPGKYEALFDISLSRVAGEQCQLVIEVTDHADRFLAQRSLSAIETLSAATCTLTFVVKEPDSRLEFRIYADGFTTGVLHFSGVGLKRFDSPVDLPRKSTGSSMLKGFIIFSEARCGSTTLLEMLNLYPGISCDFEPFSPAIRRELGKGEVTNLADLTAELDTIWSRVNGFKHVWHTSGWPFGNNDALNDFLLCHGAQRIIFLTRRNMLKRIVSNQMSGQADCWELKTKKGRDLYDNFLFEPINKAFIEQNLEAEIVGVEKKRGLLSVGTVPWIEIKYEDLYCADPSKQREMIAKILSFLDVESVVPESIVAEMQNLLGDRQRKMNNIATYSRVPYIREVEECFGSDETGWLLADSDPYQCFAHSLPSNTGKPEGTAIIAEAGRDPEGYLIYGPRIHLVAGLYRVTITHAYLAKPETLKPVNYDFVIWKSSQATVLDQAAMPFIDKLPHDFTREVRIPVKGNGVFEVRTYYRGSGSIRIESITVTYLSA